MKAASNVNATFAGERRPVTCYLCYKKVAASAWEDASEAGHRRQCAQSERGAGEEPAIMRINRNAESEKKLRDAIRRRPHLLGRKKRQIFRFDIRCARWREEEGGPTSYKQLSTYVQGDPTGFVKCLVQNSALRWAGISAVLLPRHGRNLHENN